MEHKTIFLSADHNGIALKAKIRSFLRDLGHTAVDFGPYLEDGKVDYNHYAANVGRAISQGDGDYGVLVCGTGVGVNIVANRYSGVRSVLAHNMMTAEKSREHNDSNILCLGAWVNDDDTNLELLNIWLTNSWGDLRHSKRVNMIDRQKTGLVLTNGVFDVVHRGHLELLKFAKAQGSKLVVAIDSDVNVKKNKGDDRPINCQEDRRVLLESLEFVDEVVIFENALELQSLYKEIQPDVIVKGSEWTSSEVRTRDKIPDEIAVKVYPMVSGFSSTNAISKMQGKT